MKKSYVINGKRIRLRSIKEVDIELLRIWRNKDEIRTFFFGQVAISSKKQQEWFQSYKKRGNDLMFIIETMEGEHIGAIALYNIDYKNKSGEYGRLMIGNNKFLGKGFAREATEEILKFGFKALGLHRIYLQVFEENTKTRTMYERAGFKVEGTLRAAFLKRAKGCKNVVQMAILEENFQKCFSGKKSQID